MFEKLTSEQKAKWFDTILESMLDFNFAECAKIFERMGADGIVTDEWTDEERIKEYVAEEIENIIKGVDGSINLHETFEARFDINAYIAEGVPMIDVMLKYSISDYSNPTIQTKTMEQE